LNEESNKGFGVGPTINPYTKVYILFNFNGFATTSIKIGIINLEQAN